MQDPLFPLVLAVVEPNAERAMRVGVEKQVEAFQRAGAAGFDFDGQHLRSGGNEEITLGKQTVKSRAYCSSFNFKGSDQQKLVAKGKACPALWKTRRMTPAFSTASTAGRTSVER